MRECWRSKKNLPAISEQDQTEIERICGNVRAGSVKEEITLSIEGSQIAKSAWRAIHGMFQTPEWSLGDTTTTNTQNQREVTEMLEMSEMNALKAAFEAANDALDVKSCDFIHAVALAYAVGKEQGRKETAA